MAILLLSGGGSKSVLVCVNGPIRLQVGHAEEEDPKAIQAYERTYELASN
jgi:hypothetical protein